MFFKDKLFYKYLTVSSQMKKWGLYLTGAGYTEVSGQDEYPLKDHPEHHYFHWSTGRRLSEYQILYITKGKGIFESESSGCETVKTGDLFILFPAIWHRFSPEKSTGWIEYWIEFNGYFANYLRTNAFLKPEEPVMKVGTSEDLKENFLKIIRLVKEDDISIQYIASGILLQILGQIAAGRLTGSSREQDMESKIRMARTYIYDNMNLPLSPEKIARELGIGYSLFRKQFRKFTGFSPVQYQIQLRIQKAKELLSSTCMPVNLISDRVGFESANYFSRIFRQKTGITPRVYRSGNFR